MTRRAAALAAAALLACGPVWAQSKFLLHLSVKDASAPNDPRFEAPSVTYFVSPDALFSDDTILRTVTPEPRDERDRYTYGTRPEEAIGDGQFANRYAFIEIFRPPYVVVDPRLLRVQLNPNDLGTPMIRTVQLEHPANLAEIYRSELNQILRGSDIGTSGYEQAFSAARSAIGFDPRLDNYLLAVRVLRSNLGDPDADLAFAPDTISNLESIEGFAELSFEDRWTVLLELMDTLVGAEDPDRRYGTRGTVAEAAIQLGQEMLDYIDVGDPAQAALPVVKVFQHLSYLHALNEDCLSLVENAEAALTDAEAVEMAWTAQRRFFLEWGDCLEQVTRFGDGRAREEVLAAAAVDPFLKQLWAGFGTAAGRAETRLRFATGDADRRILDLYEFSQSVVQQGG